MPRVLEKTPFSAALLPIVQDFDCGDDDSSREVAEWIKGPVMEDLGPDCEVWLYSTPEDGIVGYGSLGGREWRYPNSTKSPRMRINTIPFVGIQWAFQGQPRGESETKFFVQIMGHLALEARKHTDRFPLLGLFVRPENQRAIAAYRKIGFEEFPPPYTDGETGVIYARMIAYLDVLDQSLV
jgi:GNAT superfamily N-acetyltransferase